MHRALNAAGFGVVEAKTRSQALEALLSHSFRLVILPLSLAGDGMEDIAEAIAGPATHTALIVLTENGVLPAALRSHPRVKAVDIPFSVTTLVEAAVTLASSVGPTGDSVSL